MKYDVVVIGGGPAGLAAALAAKGEGATVAIIEREARLGGILKQCIHDGFGLITFKEKLSGPEYAERYIDMLTETDVDVRLLTFVTRIVQHQEGYAIHVVSRSGVEIIEAATIVLATGCRERTAKQIFIQGTRPAGVFTAGTAQHFVNLLGQMPTKRCVILGSGDIGLIMARRLTLEGAEVEGVYEVKSTPSGLTRNIHQCLYDYNIPLHLSHTVTRVFGVDRLEAVEVAAVDDKMQIIEGTSKKIFCDALILSVGLIPENELAESMGITLNSRTKGPDCDQRFMTNLEGVFCAGNALHVNDLVDYVSECAKAAGVSAAHYSRGERSLVAIQADNSLLYAVPNKLDIAAAMDKVILYFRSSSDMNNATFSISVDNKTVFTKKYPFLRPPEMERLELDFGAFGVTVDSKIELKLEV